MIFCKNCGASLENDTFRCPSCGTLVPVFDELNDGNNHQQQPFGQYGQQPFNQPHNRPYGQSPYGQPFYQQSYIHRKKPLQFAYVVSLVFMIIFILRTILSFATLNSYPETFAELEEASTFPFTAAHKQVCVQLYMLAIITSVITFLIFAGQLIALIFASKARGLQATPDSGLKSAKKLFIILIIVLALVITYTILEIVLIAAYSNFIEQFGAQLTETKKSDWKAEIFSQSISSFVFDAAFIALSIVSIIKTKMHIKTF